MLKRSYSTYKNKNTSFSPELTIWTYLLKRTSDYLVAGILLFILCPFFLLITVLIALDSSGPIFFRQKRIGLGGKQFFVWKFRTMVENAENLQPTLEDNNEVDGGVLFKIKHDPRITRIGKNLRHYSLDEFPQLFNVLLGQMSLIGPRPLPVRDVQRMPEQYQIRHSILPGITGLGQINGRSNCSSEEYLKWDNYYIRHWSLLLDLKILLKTIPSVLNKTGAF